MGKPAAAPHKASNRRRFSFQPLERPVGQVGPRMKIALQIIPLRHLGKTFNIHSIRLLGAEIQWNLDLKLEPRDRVDGVSQANR